MLIEFTNSETDLLRILQLQQQNLPKNISRQEAIEQGFVTVEHSFELLKQLCDAEPAAVAKEGKKVVGYALVMTKTFADKIPVLFSMFELFKTIPYQNKNLADHNYFVMGQVCIDRAYRGMGLFDQLYAKLKTTLAPRYDLMITEVAERNVRSIKAHERAGLKTIHTYAADGEIWHVMVMELRPFL